MSQKSVFCIATTRGHADRIVDQLKAASFSNNDISVLFPDRGTTRDFAHEKNTKAPEGAVTGGVIGGALGWIAGIGALAIPGVGPFIAAGPVMVALSGAAVGAAVGGIAGGLVGMGIPELEAKRFANTAQDLAHAQFFAVIFPGLEDRVCALAPVIRVQLPRRFLRNRHHIRTVRSVFVHPHRFLGFVVCRLRRYVLCHCLPVSLT